MHKALWDDGYPIHGYFISDNRQAARLLFRFVKELLLHHTEPCTAERWVGFALTLRDEVAPAFELGLEEAAVALEAFRKWRTRSSVAPDCPGMLAITSGLA